MKMLLAALMIGVLALTFQLASKGTTAPTTVPTLGTATAVIGAQLVFLSENPAQ